MKTSGYTEAQFIAILRQGEGRMPVAELCREHGMSNAAFCKWRAKDGGMDASLRIKPRQRLKRNKPDAPALPPIATIDPLNLTRPMDFMADRCGLNLIERLVPNVLRPGIHQRKADEMGVEARGCHPAHRTRTAAAERLHRVLQPHGSA